MALDPNRRLEDPNPPRERVEFLKLGRLVAELATLVRPVVEPTLRFSAVRKPRVPSLDRYSGCDIIEPRPPNIDPIM